MKKIFTLLLFVFFIAISPHAQTIPNFWSCNRSFTNAYPGVTVRVIYNEYYGKCISTCVPCISGCTIPNFTDVRYLEDNGFTDGADKMTCSFPYSCKTNDADGSLPSKHYDGTLKYDVYYPEISGFTTPPELPVIFFFHAGGFSDCSYKSLPGIVQMCMEFAARGFICINVEYRRGVIQDNVNSLLYSTVQQQMAIYRACQDGRGGVSTVLKKDSEGWENDKYRIDENQIFLAGMSAGGLIAMNIAYYDDNMVASIFPTTGINTAQQVLGPINNSDYYYYSDPTASYQSHIVAILDMWGGLPMPKQYWNMADQSGFFAGHTHYPAMIAFAGAKDDVFPLYPFKSNGLSNSAQKEFFSGMTSGSTYYSESRCLPYNSPYTIENVQANYDLDLGSTYNMYLILKTLGITTEMNIDCQMHHGLDKDCGGCPTDPLNLSLDKNCNTCAFTSDFGTGDINTTQVQHYMVLRACIFFQDIVNAVVINGRTTLFNECENTRGACDGTFTGCSSAPECQH